MTSTEMVVVGMKYIVCFSGGHSSAIAAVEIVRKYLTSEDLGLRL